MHLYPGLTGTLITYALYKEVIERQTHTNMNSIHTAQCYMLADKMIERERQRQRQRQRERPA